MRVRCFHSMRGIKAFSTFFNVGVYAIVSKFGPSMIVMLIIILVKMLCVGEKWIRISGF